MNLPEDDFVARRELLAMQIAQQRGELAQAYRQLETPIHYAEYGLRGFGFLRNNPWVLAAVPAAFSLISTAISLRKKKPVRPEPNQQQTLPKPDPNPTLLKLWLGRLVRLYQLYRQVRPLFP